jgi:hypothetical protein
MAIDRPAELRSGERREGGLAGFAGDVQPNEIQAISSQRLIPQDLANRIEILHAIHSNARGRLVVCVHHSHANAAGGLEHDFNW